MNTRIFLSHFILSTALATLATPGKGFGAGDPRCPHPIRTPTQLQLGEAAISFDYAETVRKKAGFREMKYAEANDELDAWMKKKYGVTMAEFSGPAPKPSRRAPDPDEIARERQRILAAKNGEAEALFDAWLRKRYDVSANEFEKAIADYFDRQKQRFQTELIAAHLTEEQCSGGSHE